VTTLAWTALSFRDELQAAGELDNVHAAIKWGTDYLLKCAARKNKLWVQVIEPLKCIVNLICLEGRACRSAR
jgi:endoglucanase